MAPGSRELVEAARDLAGRFDRGGRLWAVGNGRAAADARHVAVEFLHPVIVGKRALPAGVGADRREPDDVVIGIGYGGSTVTGEVDIAIADHAVPGARHVLALPSDDAFAAKEAALLTYHVLWELVHVFLGTERRSASGAATLDALYPMLYGAGSADPPAPSADTDAVASTDAKRAESADTRACALAANDGALTRAAAVLADAPAVFTFGNGGSASDASDLAWALGGRARALSDDVATVTALANDVGFDVVFARQLATLARPGDAVIALSTSGGSANILAGLAEARRRGVRTIGFAGYGGGEMGTLGLDACGVVASSSVHRIQEAYVTLYDEMLRRAGLERPPPPPDRS